MGDHDPDWIWHEHPGASIHDNGRTFRPVHSDEYVLVGVTGKEPRYAPPSDSRKVFLLRGQMLLPETVYIHSTDQFDITQWESIYSAVLTSGHSPFSRASFIPIVDESYHVVGHVGWADGSDILVPEVTVRNNRRFWSLLQQERLDKLRQRLLDDKWDQGPMGEFRRRFETHSAAPPAPVRVGKCVYTPPGISLDSIFDKARRGPLSANTELVSMAHLANLEDFLKGGGEARVGRHFQEPGQGFYLNPDRHPLDGQIGSPKMPFSSGYEFLVLVNPEGHVQGVMQIQSNLKTEGEWLAEKALQALDIVDKVMTVLMVVEVAPIAVVLLRMGATIAKGAAIRAIRLVLNDAMKAALKRLLEREAKRIGEEAVAKTAETVVLDEVVFDAETMARWEARGKRLHLDKPGGQTVGVGEMWREGEAVPEEYWAKSGPKNENLTRPALSEEEAKAKAAAEAKAKAEAEAKAAKGRPPEPPKPTDQPIATYVTEPKPIEGPNRGIPEHMADSNPTEKNKWLKTKEGNKWLDTQELDGADIHAGSRNHEAETYMFGRLEERTTKDTAGEFHFMMDHPTCPACKNLQFAFRKTRPKIKLIQHDPGNELFITKAQPGTEVTPKAPSGPQVTH